jgi:hypothetical protein
MRDFLDGLALDGLAFVRRAERCFRFLELEIQLTN